MRRNTTSYQKVAAQLRRSITAGDWEPGGRLPTEMEMTQKFKVSRITVRHALQLLEEEEGLILRRPKLGTFVSAQPRRLVPISMDYTASLQQHAPEAERTLVKCRTGKVGKASDWLKLPGDSPALYFERVDRLNSKPFAWDQATIPMAYADKLTTEDLEDIAFAERWADCQGLHFSSIQQVVETVIHAPASRHLKTKDKQAALKTTEVYYDQRNRPCGVFVTFYHPKQVRLRIQYGLH